MKYLVFLSALLFSCNSKPPETINVFAAASLKELVTEISQDWTHKTGQEVRVQFEASSTLAKQIQEGAPADLFITAAPEWLDPVKPSERFDWLGNRLVCVARPEVKDFDLQHLESLTMANEQVPAGKYAKMALAQSKVPLPKRVVYGSNVRDVLSKVSNGAAAVGIVYATDAAMAPELRIVHTFSLDSHPPILYSAGLLKPSAREFFLQLREPWAMEWAKKRGFVQLASK